MARRQLTQRRGTSRHVAHCYELCALNPYFSQRLRARCSLAPSSHLRMAKRHGRRASRSRRGIKDRLRRIDERENNRGRARHTMGRERRKCSRTRTRACFAGKEVVPYTAGNYIRAVKLSRRMQLHATRPAHTRARKARRDMRERCRQWA